MLFQFLFGGLFFFSLVLTFQRFDFPPKFFFIFLFVFTFWVCFFPLGLLRTFCSSSSSSSRRGNHGPALRDGSFFTTNVDSSSSSSSSSSPERAQHGPALWNGAFFTHQLREPSSSNRPKRESSAALPESNVKRSRVASAASSSAPISRANGKGKDRANEGLKPCLPGFKRSSLSDPDVPTAQNVSNMASNPINIPNVEQPVINEAFETPFGFAKSSTFTMELFKKMGYKEGSGLGKDGQGIKEPIRVGIWTKKQGLGFQTAQTSEQNAGDQNVKQNQ